jgi:hypothetical protein
MIKRATGQQVFGLSQEEEETESGLGRIFFANDRPAQRLTLAVNQLMDDLLFKTTTIGALLI